MAPVVEPTASVSTTALVTLAFLAESSLAALTFVVQAYSSVLSIIFALDFTADDFLAPVYAYNAYGSVPSGHFFCDACTCFYCRAHTGVHRASFLALMLHRC